MEVTNFIVALREKALLEGDYGTYRTQLSGKLLNTRRKLNIATKHRGKFHRRENVTLEQINEDHEYLHMQLLTAERAWAHAMAMKTAHASDNKGLSALTRSHIVSRLVKAARTAESLTTTLEGDGSASASHIDILEAQAYAALLRGAAWFENQNWQACLKSYAAARIIYSTLKPAAKRDVFSDLITETIDPSLRYAAYKLNIPRTQPIPSIARQFFPSGDTPLVNALKKANPKALEEEDASKRGSESIPQTLTWRSREVKIEDAAISERWSAVQTAKAQLERKLSSKDLAPKDMAAAYDDLLTASQDAVDATRQAIEDMRSEGVSQGDPRMQSLQITRTAVNYENISWRIGRNRVLIGEKDGLANQSIALRRRKKKKAAKGSAKAAIQELGDSMPLGRRLTHIKEKVVLYDATLQSIESIRELPGVAADEGLTAQLDATHQYFDALKCVALATSHSWLGQQVNALALASHAAREAEAALSGLARLTQGVAENPPNIGVSKGQAKFLHERLQGLVQRYRALVEIGKLQEAHTDSRAAGLSRPLVDRLDEYPAEGVNLDNIVTYPPKLEMIPVKPLFLDVAWNYIAYPSQDGAAKSMGRVAAAPDAKAAANDKQPQKRGWFGFGR